MHSSINRLCLSTAPSLRAPLSAGKKLAYAASPRRPYAFQAAGAPAFQVFNRRTKWLQKERAASNVEGSRQADYLKDEVAMRLCERLLVSCIASLFRLSESDLFEYPY